MLGKAEDNLLCRRTSGIGYKLAVFILQRTIGAAARPTHAAIPMADYQMRTGKSERMVYAGLAELDEAGILERDGRGRVRICIEKLADMPATVRKCRPRSAAVREPDRRSRFTFRKSLTDKNCSGESIENKEEVGLLRRSDDGAQVDGRTAAAAGSDRTVDYVEVEPERVDRRDNAERSNAGTDNGVANVASGTTPNEGASPLDDGLCSVDAGGRELPRRQSDIGIRDSGTATGAIQIQVDGRKPETYCAWGWTCPHLQAPPVTPSETAYLARFLQPATRIGEVLQLDDSRARASWEKSLAVQPDLTPRVFVLIARAKMREWQRQDDSRPGLKIRNMAELLTRSMPEAVASFRYLDACEQAPYELQRDRAAAREILAGESLPRERAWARAVLAEAGLPVVV